MGIAFNWSCIVIHTDQFTCTNKSGRVRVPPPIWCAYCPHPLSWNKPWATSEEYLSTLSCIYKCFNGAIPRDTGITTVNCRKKLWYQEAIWPPLLAGLIKFTYGWNGLHHSTAAPIAVSSHNSDSVQYIIRQSDCSIYPTGGNWHDIWGDSDGVVDWSRIVVLQGLPLQHQHNIVPTILLNSVRWSLK